MTSPLSERSSSVPENRDSTPRPQIPAVPPFAVPVASENELPVRRSRPVMLRSPKVLSSSSRTSRVPPGVSASPAMVRFVPGLGGPASRVFAASTICSATVRPKRESQAAGMWSLFSMVPVASPSARYAPDGFESVTVSVSEPSSWESSSTATATVFEVSSGAKVRVPESAV